LVETVVMEALHRWLEVSIVEVGVVVVVILLQREQAVVLESLSSNIHQRLLFLVALVLPFQLQHLALIR